MRTKIGQLPKHPSWLGDWWIDLPGRQAWWWKWLFFEPGSGWLRWKCDAEYHHNGYYEPPEDWQVAPPVRRALILLLAWLRHPLDVRRGDCAWNEWCTRSDITTLRSEERVRGHW